jgi:hypothetical protein
MGNKKQSDFSFKGRRRNDCIFADKSALGRIFAIIYLVAHRQRGHGALSADYERLYNVFHLCHRRIYPFGFQIGGRKRKEKLFRRKVAFKQFLQGVGGDKPCRNGDNAFMLGIYGKNLFGGYALCSALENSCFKYALYGDCRLS